jgi:hypothetical protein
MSEADPFAPTDPLEAAPPAERVNYATGVLLDAEDFADEQTYHRGRLAAALRHLAGFGTLAGLRVLPPAEDDAERELGVAPGVAIDRHGRLLELTGPQCIRLFRWFAAQNTPALRAATHRAPRVSVPVAVVVDVFLSARTCARGKTPAFATGPFDALDAVVPARLAEAALLELVARTEDAPADIPTPANFWPAADASDDEKLQAVLGSWDGGTAGSTDGQLDPLREHVEGHDTAAVFLARVTIPVVLAEDAAADARPVLDLTTPVSVDNSARPFVFLPGKWLGRAFDAAPLVQP